MGPRGLASTTSRSDWRPLVSKGKSAQWSCKLIMLFSHSVIAGPAISPCSSHSSWSCAALRQRRPASRDQLTDQEQCEAAKRITTRAKILSIDGPKTQRQKRSEFRGRQSGPPQFKNVCGHKRSQGVENNCSRRCKTMETQWSSGMQNFCRVPAETIETCTIFRPAAKFCRQKTATVLASRNGPQNGGQVIRTQANQIEAE